VCFFTGYHSKSSSAVCCSAWAIVVPEKASLGLSDCGNYRSSGEVEKILWTAGISGRELVHIGGAGCWDLKIKQRRTPRNLFTSVTIKELREAMGLTSDFTDW